MAGSSRHFVIINADDFGRDPARTRGIALAFREGKISSASLIANLDGAKSAAALAKSEDFAESVGCHLNLTLGLPIRITASGCSGFCRTDGSFRPFRYSSWLSGVALRIAKEELKAQIDRCRSFGLAVSHVDTHHHIHFHPQMLLLVSTVAKETNVHFVRPLRNWGPVSPFRRLWAAIGNRILESRNQLGVKFFAYLSDFRTSRISFPGGIEFQVHPSSAPVTLDEEERRELSILQSSEFTIWLKAQQVLSYADVVKLTTAERT